MMDLVSQARQMTSNLSKGSSFVYILQLQSGMYYVGSSTDFELRLHEHQIGTACRTTKIDPPKSLLWMEAHPDFSSVRKREAQLKKWSRAKKEALIKGNFEKLKALSESRD